jgi:hypothetical protein
MLDLRTLHRALGGDLSGGRLLCPGPGHSAADRSLSVKVNDEAPDGFLVHSFAGDDPIICKNYVREKLGLPAFKPNGGNGRRRASDDAVERALMAAVQGATSSKPKGRLVATFSYTDADGTLLYQVLKYDPKTFKQRQPDGNGGWIWNLDDVRRVPYRWLELLQYPDATIFVCEGEKDADRVASLEHCATCVAAGKRTADCVKAFAGHDVIILQDKDAKRGGEPGRTKALTAARALHCVAKSIRIVLLPELNEDINDVSDWLDADPRRAEKLANVCFDVPVWTPEAADTEADQNEDAEAKQGEAEANTKPDEGEANTKPDAEPPLPFINIAAWHNAPTPEREWVVRDRVPLAAVTLMSGEGGVGKTILALHLAVATALGRDWLNALPTPGSTLVVCCEDDTDELHRRLDRIVKHYNATLGATYQELKDMHLLSLAGQDAVLAAPRRNGLSRPRNFLDASSKPHAISGPGSSCSTTRRTCSPATKTIAPRSGNSSPCCAAWQSPPMPACC